MADFQTDSFKLAEELINVRYRGASAADLLKKCEQWLDTYKNTEWETRERYKGQSGLIARRLDIWDISKTRVENIMKECR